MAGEYKRVGLSPEEVERSRAAHGANVLQRQKRKSFWRVFLTNLGDPVIRILLAALFLNLLFLLRSGDWVETVGIAGSVLLATLISTVSEYRSETAFARLSDACGATRCRVRRGNVMEIDATEVVVGDILLLSAGERVAADGELISGTVTVDQSALTGESREVEKRPNGAKKGNENKTPASSEAVFSGCAVLSGEGEMRVFAVGDQTFLGGISGELQSGGRESPLKAKLTRLAHQISRIGYAAAAVCVVAFLFRRLMLDTGFAGEALLAHLKDIPYVTELFLRALMLGLTVVVVAVPEGLPMMIAVVLSSNIRRMTKDGVLVRKPAGLEAAGGMNILFTDKTGTLTGGKMSVGSILTATGSFRSTAALEKREVEIYRALARAVHANSGAVRGVCEGRETVLGGNATDRALLSAFLRAPSPVYSVRERLPFDSARKYAATLLTDGTLLVTGAPELLMPCVESALGVEHFDKSAFLGELCAHTQRGERVVLLCEGRGETCTLTKGLTLLAAVCLFDPIREGAREAVRTLKRAGVQVVMMTGDGRETAVRIAREVGILAADGVCLEGGELAAMSDEEVSAVLPRLAVISRALPADKSRLVRLSAEAGLVVGMTGDGINDAPALKAADVGFAMGSGTQVAKEAGDVVILDDDLASIARAVLYGRTIFKSIRKFITLQLVMNFCAVGISIIGPFIGFETPVTVVQMLWINLIMDTLGGLAFAGEAPMPHYMKEPPKRRSEPILTRSIAARIAFLSLASVGLFVLFLKSGAVRALYRESEGDVCLLTAFFALFIFSGVFNCLNARTDRVSFFAGLGKNAAFIVIMTLVAAVQVLFIYLGGAVLRTVPLTLRELGVTLLLSLLVLPLGWLQLLHRRLSGKGGLY